MFIGLIKERGMSFTSVGTQRESLGWVELSSDIDRCGYIAHFLIILHSDFFTNNALSRSYRSFRAKKFPSCLSFRLRNHLEIEDAERWDLVDGVEAVVG